MKAWNETGPQTSLRGELKMEGIQLLHVPFSNVQYQHKSPICIFICFLLLICCGLLIFILRHSELCWMNRLGQQNFTVILDCCRGPALSCLPSQGLPSFPNSCRCSPCQDLTTTDQSPANSVFGSGQPVKQQRLPMSLSHSTSFFLILSFSSFLFLPLANKILPSSASNKL